MITSSCALGKKKGGKEKTVESVKPCIMNKQDTYKKRKKKNYRRVFFFFSEYVLCSQQITRSTHFEEQVLKRLTKQVE